MHGEGRRYRQLAAHVKQVVFILWLVGWSGGTVPSASRRKAVILAVSETSPWRVQGGQQLARGERFLCRQAKGGTGGEPVGHPEALWGRLSLARAPMDVLLCGARVDPGGVHGVVGEVDFQAGGAGWVAGPSGAEDSEKKNCLTRLSRH